MIGVGTSVEGRKGREGGVGREEEGETERKKKKK